MPRHYDKYVPDEGPVNANILLVGEAPGGDEHEQGRPFVGASGDILINVLERAGVSRGQVRLANLCHYCPYDNKFENVLGSDALKQGIQDLYAWITNHRPTVIIPLGSYPLYYLTGKNGVLKWRGSIIPFIGGEFKCIPTVHPAAVLRDRGLYPTFDFDIKRAIEESTFPELKHPTYDFVINPTGFELEEAVEELCNAEYLGTDIETIKKSRKILCVGFAPTPSKAVVFTPDSLQGGMAIQRVLNAPNKKIFHNGTFDTIQLITLNGFTFNDPSAFALNRPYYWDTMIAQHVMNPELPRALAYITSLYTRQPYYKHSGKDAIPDDDKGWTASTDRQTLYEYNGTDCCVTLDIALQQMEEIASRGIWANRMQFDMEQLVIAHHISNSGMLRDEERRLMLEKVLLQKWIKKQFILNRMTGFETNVKSPKIKNILYDKDKLGLPARYNREGKMTADEDAIVGLIQYCKSKLEKLVRKDAIIDWQIKLAVCQTILEIRGIRQMLSNYIRAAASGDGRIRSTYKVAGTETGRWSASAYVDGTGYNSQTNPRDPVDVPDEMLTNDAESVILLSQLEEDANEAETENEENEAA